MKKNFILCFIFLFKIINCDNGEWNKSDLPTEISDEDSFSSRSNDDKNIEKIILPETSFYGSQVFDQIHNNNLKNESNFKNQNYSIIGRSFRELYKNEFENDNDNKNEKKTDEIENYDKESRIMNINDEIPIDKEKITIQGYIPIVGLSDTLQKKKQRQFSDNSKFQFNPSNYPINMNSYFNPYSIFQYPNNEQQRSDQNKQKTRIGSTLQNLATSLTGSMTKLTKRKQTVDYSSFAKECVCVPFYMCRAGYIEQNNKNVPYGSNKFLMSEYNHANEPNLFEENLQEAQAELSKYYTPQQIEEIIKAAQQERSLIKEPVFIDSSSLINQQPHESQQNYASINPALSSNLDLELPINERSIDGKQNTHFSLSNDTDLEALSRMFGLPNSFSNKNDGSNCGVLRTCCPLLSSKEILIAQKSLSQNTDTINHKKNQNLNLGNNNFPISLKQYNPHFSNSYTSNPYISNQPTNFFYPQTSNILNNQNPLRNYAKSIDLNNPHNYLYGQSNRNEKVYSFSNNFKNKYCGIRPETNNQARVQNLNYPSSSAEFGEYPWQAALLKRLGSQDSLFVCGGTLINDLWIATAAHCIKKNTALDLKIRLGEWDVHRDDEFYSHIEKNIIQIIKHPKFYAGTLENDIALLKLETPVNLENNPHIMPACIPHYGENFAGKKCWVAGWGKDSFGHQGEYQSVLKEVDLPVIGHAQCNAALRRSKLGPSYDLHAGFMCAGGERGKDACEGDGGSALVCEVSGIWKVAGLVSWGIGCGKQGMPGVYVNVGYYSNWINEIINSHSTKLEGELPEVYIKSNSKQLVNKMGSNSETSLISNTDNKIFEPASIINERSNSKTANGTEIDELVIPETNLSTKKSIDKQD